MPTPTQTKADLPAASDAAPATDQAALVTALQAQVAQLTIQFQELQGAIAQHAATGLVPRMQRVTGERVPTCTEGGERHPVTRTFTRRQREGSNQTTQLMRKCDSCLKEWVIVDYGA